MRSISAAEPRVARPALVSLAAAFAVLVALVGGLVSAPGPAAANGWQWHSIPRPALVAGLESDSPRRRAFAVRAFGYRRDRQVVPRLVAMLDDEGEATEVRTEILRALGRIGDPAAGPALVRALADGGSSEIAAEAADALGALGAPATLPALLEALAGKRPLVVRTRIVAALGSFPEEPAIAALAGLLRNERSRSLRRRAIRALGRMATPAAAPPLLAALETARSDRVRAEIVDALARARAPAARRPLIELLAATADPRLRVRITVALGALADGSVAPTLIRLLDDDSPPVQFFAARGLGRSGDRRGVEPLRRLYRDVARRDAALTPAEIEADPVALLADLSLRYEIVRALHRIDAPAGLDVFLDAARRRDLRRDSAAHLRLNEGVYQLRRAAVVALGYTGSEAAARTLIADLLADRDFRIRAVAVQALGVLGADGAVAALVPRLDDDTAEVRWRAAAVLGRLGKPGAASALAARLGDAHPEVRRQAVLSLGYLGAVEARERVAALARGDADAAVREAARETVRLLGGG